MKGIGDLEGVENDLQTHIPLQVAVHTEKGLEMREEWEGGERQHLVQE